ncbi:uncharacterized protein LOC143078484 [Mytilus galloprovincialis]|uniref:uncharacterized protein LOC143078484 n=1 Tax=Mytilus galloprovincialis TaxID=29158 RepID=UPI003F7B94A5
MSFLLETRNWDIIAPSMLWILRFLRHFRCFEKLQGQQNSNIYTALIYLQLLPLLNQGRMPMTKAEKQKAYRDRKKQQEGESYLEKERQRTKAYYVPIAERSKTDQEKRRKKVRKLVQKHRERNRQSTIEPSTSQPSQQVESTSQEQEQVVSSSTDNPISTPLVVKTTMYERLVKRTTQNKSSEHVGQDKETGNDTHGNDGPSSSKSGTEKLTPRKRTYKELRDEDHILVQMDFAENFACSSADEVQSAYWNGTVVTLHPVVVYFKENSDTLKHKNFVYVSDDLGHNFGAVYAFIKDIVNEMKAAVNDIKMVHYWTDSPSSQYRNKSAFYVVSDHKNLLGIQAIWNYFETGHGKGPCDGIGGTSKRTADLAIRQGKIVVQNASDYFEKVGPLHKSASYCFVSSKDIDICRKEVEEINKSLIALKGTMQVHQVASVSKGRVKTCTTSCYCEYCIVGTLHDYSEGVIVKSRRNVEQNVETNLTVTQGDQNDEPETTTPGDNRYKQDDAVTSEDASKDIVEGDWVAVTYDDEWHIGKIGYIVET